MHNAKPLGLAIAVCLLCLAADCPQNPAGDGVPIRIFPPGTIVEFGSRTNIPFTKLFGCGQADGFSGFSGGSGTLNEFGTLGTNDTGPVFSISATAVNGTDGFASGACEAFGEFTVTVPTNQSSVFGNMEATIQTDCTLSENINGYTVQMFIEIRGDRPQDNTIEFAQFCHSIDNPGTQIEVVVCDEPYTSNQLALIFLTIRDFEFRPGVTYSLGARLRNAIDSSEAAPEYGGSIQCTMSVSELSVCLEPNGCAP